MHKLKVRRAAGRALRKETPRKSHGLWRPASDRPDPINLLRDQDAGRIEHLIPIKYGRMAASPFAFLRGSAAVMAADLANTPSTGLEVQLCGDAHLSNFGVFATPERKLVFDINDFDESHPGPWEWDLKRLVASAVVAGRENELKDKVNKRLVKAIIEKYSEFMRIFAGATALDLWYFHVEVGAVQDAFERTSKVGFKSTKKMISKARTKTQEQTLEKFTTNKDGRRRIISEPPLLVPMDELLSEDQKDQLTRSQVEELWGQYMESLPVERRMLLSRFRLTDAALRVGGVGSVGTHCFIMVLEGESEQDAIILQQKEAGSSVLEAYTAVSEYDNPAERVVRSQRLMQASSDIFLGWHHSPFTDRSYYWRQLKDMKGSLDVSDLDSAGFETYLKVCAVCLARAHGRTGDAAMISSYIGRGNPLVEGMTNFAIRYADQTEKDHEALVKAIASGEIQALEGI